MKSEMYERPTIGSEFETFALDLGDITHHDSLGVATQRVLQQPRQLGVAVRDVGRLAVHQGRYNIAQDREGLVDLGGFFEAGARRLCLALTFRALEDSTNTKIQKYLFVLAL